MFITKHIQINPQNYSIAGGKTICLPLPSDKGLRRIRPQRTKQIDVTYSCKRSWSPLSNSQLGVLD